MTPDDSLVVEDVCHNNVTGNTFIIIDVDATNYFISISNTDGRWQRWSKNDLHHYINDGSIILYRCER